MSTILTTKFRIHNAESFKEGFNEGPKFDGDDSSGNPQTSIISTNVYTAIGKITPWSPNDENLGGLSASSDTNIPDPIDSMQSDFEVWRNMISLKKIQPSDVSHSIPRVNWAEGKVYSMYKDDSTVLFNDYTNQPFYAMTDEFKVYKCLFNNNGQVTTLAGKPTQTITTPFETSDGYVWKYMYTVSSADAFKFMTENYIPVKKILSNPGSGCSAETSQWDVQSAAIDGAIEYVYRHYSETGTGTAGAGAGYVHLVGALDGTGSAIANNNEFILNSGIATDDYYNGATIYFPTPGQGLPPVSFLISDYDGTSKKVTVDLPSGVTDVSTLVTDNAASIEILPTVKVDGDGTGFEAVAVMNTTNQIEKVKILNSGTGYTKATISFGSPSLALPTTDAIFSAVISPRGGHGSDAVRELGGYFIMLNTKFNYNESGFGGKKLPTANDFRQISLIREPSVYDNSQLATDNIYNQTKTLVLTLETSTNFIADDVIIQEKSGVQIASAVVVDVETVGNFKHVRITNIDGTFETFTSSNGTLSAPNGSGATTDLLNSILNEDLKPYSGDVLFVEQRRPIERDNSQIEDIKIVLEF